MGYYRVRDENEIKDEEDENGNQILHWRREQTGVTQIWWVVKQKQRLSKHTLFASLLPITKRQKFLIFSRRFPVLRLLGPHKSLRPFVFLHTLCPYCSSTKKDIDPFFFFIFCCGWNFCLGVKTYSPTRRTTHHFHRGFSSSIGMKFWVCFDFVFSFWVWIGVVNGANDVIVVSCSVCDSSTKLSSFCMLCNGFDFFLCSCYRGIVDCCRGGMLPCSVSFFESKFCFAGFLISTFKICGDV